MRLLVFQPIDCEHPERLHGLDEPSMLVRRPSGSYNAATPHPAKASP